MTVNAIKADGDATNFYSHIPCGMWHQPKPPQHQQEGFLLTHPVWDVTQNVCHVFFYTSISTHTSRVGCDSRMQLGFSCIFISTHTSRVGYDAENISKKEDMEFLLTHPVWDVTFPVPRHVGARLNFYSHIPCGMWHHVHGFSFHFLLFLLTHPVWDVTPPGSHLGLPDTYFYSHIPCGMWRGKYF